MSVTYRTQYVMAAFDPGPTWTGYALLNIGIDPLKVVHFELIEGAHVATDYFNLNNLVGRAHLVALERSKVHKLFDKVSPFNICEMMYVTGRIAQMAAARGTHLIELTPMEWRHALTGRGSPTDAVIKAAVLRQMPKLPKTNNHVRDAVGLGMVAAWMVKSAGTLVVPQPV